MKNPFEQMVADYRRIPVDDATAYLAKLAELNPPQEPVKTSLVTLGLLKMAVLDATQPQLTAEERTQLTDPSIQAALDYRQAMAERESYAGTAQDAEQRAQQAEQQAQQAAQQAQQAQQQVAEMQQQLEQMNTVAEQNHQQLLQETAARQQSQLETVQARDQSVQEQLVLSQSRAQMIQMADALKQQLGGIMTNIDAAEQQIAQNPLEVEAAKQQAAAQEQEMAQQQGMAQATEMGKQQAGQAGQPQEAGAGQWSQNDQQQADGAQSGQIGESTGGGDQQQASDAEMQQAAQQTPGVQQQGEQPKGDAQNAPQAASPATKAPGVPVSVKVGGWWPFGHRTPDPKDVAMQEYNKFADHMNAGMGESGVDTAGYNALVDAFNAKTGHSVPHVDAEDNDQIGYFMRHAVAQTAPDRGKYDSRDREKRQLIPENQMPTPPPPMDKTSARRSQNEIKAKLSPRERQQLGSAAARAALGATTGVWIGTSNDVKLLRGQLKDKGKGREKTAMLRLVKLADELETARRDGERLGVDWSKVSFTPADLVKGKRVEQEHNVSGPTDVVDSDRDTARIALAHLREMSDYYQRLDKMEKSAAAIPVDLAEAFRSARLSPAVHQAITGALLSGAAGAGLGAGAGALTAGEGHRLQGAGRGALVGGGIGAVGGAVGGGFMGHNLSALPPEKLRSLSYGSELARIGIGSQGHMRDVAAAVGHAPLVLAGAAPLVGAVGGGAAGLTVRDKTASEALTDLIRTKKKVDADPDVEWSQAVKQAGGKEVETPIQKAPTSAFPGPDNNVLGSGARGVATQSSIKEHKGDGDRIKSILGKLISFRHREPNYAHVIVEPSKELHDVPDRTRQEPLHTATVSDVQKDEKNKVAEVALYNLLRGE